MIVERLWPANAWRNFHYLVACESSGEALAIDPLDWSLCLEHARARGWAITHILNTHEHGDHIGGNEPLRAATGAQVLAHAAAAQRLPHLDRALGDGEILRIGREVELECLDTPGHTRAHLCLLAHTDTPALFCGDTLFNAGAGNCHNGGDPDQLYETFTRRLARLPTTTLIHPGHDYLARNLAFTLAREPSNATARTLLASLTDGGGESAPVTTLAQELDINTFLRLHHPEVIEGLRREFPDLPRHPDPRRVFLALRELRNRW